MRVRAACVGIVIAALLGAACGDDGSTPAAPPSPTGLPSIATQPPQPPGSSPAPQRATSPDEAALGLYNAWLQGDEAAAASFATPDAVNQLFAQQASEIQFNSCAPAGSKYRCFFYYEGGGLNMNVEGSATGGYLVTKAFFIAD